MKNSMLVLIVINLKGRQVVFALGMCI